MSSIGVGNSSAGDSAITLFGCTAMASQVMPSQAGSSVNAAMDPGGSNQNAITNREQLTQPLPAHQNPLYAGQPDWVTEVTGKASPSVSTPPKSPRTPSKDQPRPNPTTPRGKSPVASSSSGPQPHGNQVRKKSKSGSASPRSVHSLPTDLPSNAHSRWPTAGSVGGNSLVSSTNS